MFCLLSTENLSKNWVTRPRKPDVVETGTILGVRTGQRQSKCYFLSFA